MTLDRLRHGLYSIEWLNCRQDAKRDSKCLQCVCICCKSGKNFSFSFWKLDLFPSVTVAHGPASFGPLLLCSFFPLLTQRVHKCKRPGCLSSPRSALPPPFRVSLTLTMSELTAWVHCNCREGHPLEWKHMWALKFFVSHWWFLPHYRLALPVAFRVSFCFFVLPVRGTSWHMKRTVFEVKVTPCARFCDFTSRPFPSVSFSFLSHLLPCLCTWQSCGVKLQKGLSQCHF